MDLPPRTARGAKLGLGPGREFDLIRSFFPGGPPAVRPDVRVGPGDDCAVVLGQGIALSCDLSVEGVHFRADWLDDREVGYRAAAAALSDLAAVAARPVGVLVALALPAPAGAAGAARLMQGIAAAAQAVGAAVLGGDVSRTTGPRVIDVTVVGEADAPVLRSGAEAGDEVWVTGELGGAAAAVAELLRGGTPEPGLRACYAEPRPRTREAVWLRERGLLHALIDLSDGLAGDATHLAAASGVAIIVDPAAVPLHPAVRRTARTAEEAFRLGVAGGEDYELCFAAPAGRAGPHVDAFERAFGLRLTRVGSVEAGEGVWFEDERAGRQALAFGGFQHFGDEP